MARLAVNVDHVATVRQARGGNEPDPVLAAGLAELAGAEGIICHLREDRRHIQDRDLKLLRETVKTRLNMEMAAVPEMVRIAREIRPDLVTLVPEKRQEVTTEGGLDVGGNPDLYRRVVDELKEKGIEVSFFVDPGDIGLPGREVFQAGLEIAGLDQEQPAFPIRIVMDQMGLLAHLGIDGLDDAIHRGFEGSLSSLLEQGQAGLVLMIGPAHRGQLETIRRTQDFLREVIQAHAHQARFFQRHPGMALVQIIVSRGHLNAKDLFQGGPFASLLRRHEHIPP